MGYRIEERVTITKAMYGWTKYGGAEHGLVKEGGRWYCQACAKEQPDEFPAYMMCVDDGNYRSFIRLCASCENLVKSRDIRRFSELKRLVERKDRWLMFEHLFKN